jgi:hypothetical protein
MTLTSRCGPGLSTESGLPNLAAPVSFKQVLSNKLHSTLVIQPIASKKVGTALLLSKLAKPTKPLHQPSLSDASDVKSKIVVLLHTSDSVTASHTMSSNNSIIVQGTHEKKRILTAYHDKFGSKDTELIVTRKKGKISDNTFLHFACMRPSLDKWYQVGDLQFYNVITTIVKECRVSFLCEDISNLCLVNKDFVKIVPKVLHWLQVDFTLLRNPHLGYQQQDHNDPHCVEMASAAMIHFGLDPGKFVRFLPGKNTGQYWDVHCTLDAVRGHVTPDNYSHIKSILLDGCPAQLTFEEPSSNKLEFISHGNFKSLVENLQLV